MLVPHGAGHPRQIEIPLSLILSGLAVWTGVTFWGSYLAAQHIDYWRAQVSNQVLKMKVQYLMAQIDKSRGYLDTVKEVEAQLYQLLQYKKDGLAVDKGNSVPAVEPQPAVGGPTDADIKELSRILSSDIDLSWRHLSEKVSGLEKEAQSRLERFEKLSAWIGLQHRMYRSTPSGWPCPGYLSSHFGKRFSPITGIEEHHAGVDISGPSGTPVRATADGVVIFSAWNSGYGNLVIVKHEFGYSTRYAHNSRLLVATGDYIKRGQILALMGQTGKASGPHCHYEVWRYNQRKNPYAFLKELDRSPERMVQLLQNDSAKASHHKMSSTL